MNRTFLLFLFVGIFLVAPARAQTEDERASTEQRLHELRQQISEDEQRLSETKLAEQASLETLRDLDRKLAIRNELTRNYQRRLAELAEESDSLRRVMTELEQDLDLLKTQYRHRAIHAYKYGRLHDLALILSASSINQMLIRVRYLNRFADQRRDKLNEIEDAASELEDRRAKMVDARVQTQLLLKEAQQEQHTMERLQQDRKRVIRELQTRRTTLEGELERKQSAASNFEARIRELIAAENARRRAAETNDPAEDVNFAGLTGSFLQNKGKLPWPSSGVVVEPFGDIVNPVHGTKTPNPGLLIATTPQAEVRSIFAGKVLSISVLPEFGRYIAIQHGEYQSVYSNFSMIYVEEGMEVEAGQVIGRSGTESEPKQAGIFFGLFKNGVAFDPMPWLRDQ
ncbi:MAG: murein hydrolase activator EnvC family protein [Rhodothermales bacterium]